MDTAFLAAQSAFAPTPTPTPTTSPTPTQRAVEAFSVAFGLKPPVRGTYRELPPATLQWAVQTIGQTIVPGAPATPTAAPTPAPAGAPDLSAMSTAEIVTALDGARQNISFLRQNVSMGDNRANWLKQLWSAVTSGEELSVAAAAHADTLLAKYAENSDLALLTETEMLARPMSQLDGALTAGRWDASAANNAR